MSVIGNIYGWILSDIVKFYEMFEHNPNPIPTILAVDLLDGIECSPFQLSKFWAPPKQVLRDHFPFNHVNVYLIPNMYL